MVLAVFAAKGSREVMAMVVVSVCQTVTNKTTTYSGIRLCLAQVRLRSMSGRQRHLGRLVSEVSVSFVDVW